MNKQTRRVLRALALGLIVCVLSLTSPLASPAAPLGELEEPGQVERRPVETPAADEEPNREEAVSIMPDSEAVDQTIEEDVPPDRDQAQAHPSGSGTDGQPNSDDESLTDDRHPDEATTIMPDSEAVDDTILEGQEDETLPAPEKSPGHAETPTDPAWSIRWQNAFIVERVDDPRYQFLFGGRIQNDWGVYAPNNDLEDQFGGDGTGTEFRRARIYFQGQFFRLGFFKAEYDFANNNDESDFNDVYAGLSIPKLGLLRVGHFKEPFSLEFQNSSNFISFNERSGGDVFSPGRNTGIMLNGNLRIRDSTYSVAFMRRTDDVGEGFSSNEDYHLTTRFTGLPYFEDGGARLLHLEFGYSHQFADKAVGTQFQQRPANDFAPDIVDTGVLSVSDVELFNFGLAIVEGPLSLQSEVTVSLPHGSIAENPIFWSTYAEVSWWITGENRRYLRGRGVFSRVVPKTRFDPEAGHWGAFETALRYSWLDLSNDGVRGGTLSEWSLALNWVLFSNLRVSNNYVLSLTGDQADAESGIAHSWVTRIQVDF
jgi:phosphate-selective porin OprO/OprP